MDPPTLWYVDRPPHQPRVRLHTPELINNVDHNSYKRWVVCHTYHSHSSCLYSQTVESPGYIHYEEIYLKTRCFYAKTFVHLINLRILYNTLERLQRHCTECIYFTNMPTDDRSGHCADACGGGVTAYKGQKVYIIVAWNSGLPRLHGVAHKMNRMYMHEFVSSYYT